jgi:hypothetical protein
LIEAARDREHRVPPRWDGHAAERIVDVLAELEPGATAPAGWAAGQARL